MLADLADVAGYMLFQYCCPTAAVVLGLFLSFVLSFCCQLLHVAMYTHTNLLAMLVTAAWLHPYRLSGGACLPCLCHQIVLCLSLRCPCRPTASCLCP